MKLFPGNNYIDKLNLALLGMSLLLAYMVPFQLFLFSYAVLGPLHYFTEINWLHARSFFVNKRRSVWVIPALGLLFALFMIFEGFYEPGSHARPVLDYLFTIRKEMFFVGLVATILLSTIYTSAMSSSRMAILVLLGTAAVFAVLKLHIGSLFLLVLFLPNVLHVYLFTGLFMWYGTLRSGSLTGRVGAIMLFASPLLIWLIPVDVQHYRPGGPVLSVFYKSDFQYLASSIATFLHLHIPSNRFRIISVPGIKIQIFIAFCYTYHYLNWFSKTTVIGWGITLSLPKMAITGVLWLAAIGLYWYDYKIGFMTLFIISLIHVFLEFPLNVISVKGIVGKLR